MYVVLYKLSKLDLSKKIYKFEKIIPTVLILLSIFVYDFKFKNIVNYKERTTDYVSLR